MDWERMFARLGMMLMFAVAGCAVSGQRGRAAILWFVAVAFLGCAFGIYIVRKEG